ncbi:hypothetical protein K5X77_04640 [Vagococcus lutrae]|uniref:lipopolysaccharide biosynthesis protein n=1 Tax=Vagococcus lutrae TaxID=81947 RepID=UPI001C947BEF|nr:hypothetical protein [Vagococcus lutrae]QZN89575.1 hypothetical protein K5X77_04640 [Vagococcus lutrae]
MKKNIKNISYTIASNMSVMLFNFLQVMIVPKLLSIEHYGYWQLYLFYFSYVTLFTFGWSDGLYLRYGGVEIDEINKRKMTAQFIMICVLQLFVSTMIIVYSYSITEHINSLIARALGIASFFVNTTYFFTHLLQATGEFKRFAANTIVGRILSLLALMMLVLTKNVSVKILLLNNVIITILIFVYTFYKTKEFFLEKKVNIQKSDIREAIDNIKVGSVLMISNTMNMFIIGSVRKSIEIGWGIEIFSKVSLMLSLVSFVITFVNAVSMVLYPYFRNKSIEDLKSIYSSLREILLPLMGIYLLTYYPLSFIIAKWLPQYTSSLHYMLLLYPLGIIEIKMNFLNNTLLKVLRKEKVMFLLNIISVLLSIFLSFLFTRVIRNIDFLVISIIFVLGIRMLMSDLFLSQILQVKKNKTLLFEIVIIILFYSVNIFVNNGTIVFTLGISVFIISQISNSKKEIIHLKKTERG